MTSDLSDIPIMENCQLQSQFDSKKFIKYPSIENLESEEDFPTPEQIRDYELQFWYSEKIDGANLGIYVPLKGERKGVPSFYSRSGQNADNLFGFAAHKNRLKVFLKHLVDFFDQDIVYQSFSTASVRKWCEGIYLWGEYYGDRINRRVKYGVDGAFKFYDIMLVCEGDTQSLIQKPKYFSDFCTAFTTNNCPTELIEGDSFLLPPIIIDSDISTKEDLMKRFPLPAKSGLCDDNTEGYVITCAGSGVFRRWKWKDPKFKEKTREKKPHFEETVNPEFNALHNEFISYITLNRAIGVLSKTTERKKVDRLVKDLLTDAKEDFMKVHGNDMKDRDPKFAKGVFNVGSLAFMTIKKALTIENAK
jgi:hypothetical protein